MGILDINIVNGTVILILLTSMTASFVTENAGKKLLIEQAKNEPLEGPAMRTQHVLVAADELKGNEKMLDFSILITDKKVKNPISVVSVLENDEEAEMKIRRSRKHIDDFITHYNSGEINVHAMATIDHNVSSGIARVSKELVADIVLVNDNSKTNLLKRLVGDDRDHLLDVCDKTVFFCHFNHNFSTYRSITLICPPLAELEQSCNQWLERVMRLSKELNCNINVYSTRETFEKIKAYRTYRRFMADLTHIAIEKPEDAMGDIGQLNEDNLLVAIFARSGSVSDFLGMENLPLRFEKENTLLDRIFVYPSQTLSENFASYSDVSRGPLTLGVEAIQRLSKEVGEIFKKSDSEETPEKSEE